MIEKPLDRLNYYNGQRLEASDLRLEQEYHIRTRRWINKSLYTPGIARGLDIRAEKDTRFVIVSPGLALDAEGQEILLLEEERICVPGKAHTNTSGSEAKVEGLYLTIQYNEKSIEEERNGCIPKSTNGKKNGNRAAWGGPALVRAKPLFSWSDVLPYESSGEIVLAQVELSPDCTKVHQLNTGVRRYVGTASSSKVRQYALEGERHIDKDNPGRVYFHVRGRQPNAVTLYLRAEKFSTLYYTELGGHSHGSDIQNGKQTGSANGVDQHWHAEGSLSNGSDSHSHVISAFMSPKKDPPEGVSFWDALAVAATGGLALPAVIASKWQSTPDYPAGPSLVGAGPITPNLPPFMLRQVTTIEETGTPLTRKNLSTVGIDVNSHSHKHTITGFTGKTPFEATPAIPRHTHSYSASITDTGVADVKARSGKALGYIKDLKVAVDGKDVTDAIIAQLKDADATWFTYSQDRLGNGLVNHPLVMDPITRKGGTGEIKLDFLPNIYFLDGEHSIELSVEGDGNGGRILYNLYVE